jgi:hypothetical protein
LDVRIAATWLIDGGRALFETSDKELRSQWTTALEEKTEYWPRTDGLTRDRWRVWLQRLRALSSKGQFDEETRATTKKAAEIVESLLKETDKN